MTAPDHRPQNCRFRLYDEGKPYPRSSCSACGATIVTGLGTSCSRITPLAEALAVAEVAALVKAVGRFEKLMQTQMRTADFHSDGCVCIRCAEDAMFAALRAIGEGRA